MDDIAGESPFLKFGGSFTAKFHKTQISPELFHANCSLTNSRDSVKTRFSEKFIPQLRKFMTSALERFLRYAKIETTSSETSGTFPSTVTQFDLARLLVEELKELGLKDAAVDKHCYVSATLPADTDLKKEVPVIGWIAHMDTSCAVYGKNVKPNVLDYQGGPIPLQDGPIIKETDDLKSCRDHKIVVSDGTTLLGADDKAGIAAIMTALDRLQTEKIPHGSIRICFTPDEEIGMGTAFFNLKEFGAFCAYTVDGGEPGQINQETFTADKANLKIIGRDIHPGLAKGVMVNAAFIMARIIAELPADRTPEHTDERLPYIYLTECSGGTSEAKAEFLLRAFEDSEREANKELLKTAFRHVLADYPNAVGSLEFKEQYLNMKKFLTAFPQVTEKLEQAVQLAGIVPKWTAIRGGTDGSRLSEMGLPTPNIFTGGRNFHSLTEWLSVDDMEKAVTTLLHLAELWTK